MVKLSPFTNITADSLPSNLKDLQAHFDNGTAFDIPSINIGERLASQTVNDLALLESQEAAILNPSSPNYNPGYAGSQDQVTVGRVKVGLANTYKGLTGDNPNTANPSISTVPTATVDPVFSPLSQEFEFNPVTGIQDTPPVSAGFLNFARHQESNFFYGAQLATTAGEISVALGDQLDGCETLNQILGAISTAGTALLNGINFVLGQVNNLIAQGIAAVAGIVNTVLTELEAIVTDIVNFIGEQITNAVDFIKQQLALLPAISLPSFATNPCANQLLQTTANGGIATDALQDTLIEGQVNPEAFLP